MCMLHCVQFLCFYLQGHQSIGRDSKKDNKTHMGLPYRSGPVTYGNSELARALAEEATTLGTETPSAPSMGQGHRPLFMA